MKAQETDEAPICPLCTNVLRVHDYLLTPDELIIFDSLEVGGIPTVSVMRILQEQVPQRAFA